MLQPPLPRGLCWEAACVASASVALVDDVRRALMAAESAEILSRLDPPRPSTASISTSVTVPRPSSAPPKRVPTPAAASVESDTCYLCHRPVREGQRYLVQCRSLLPPHKAHKACWEQKRAERRRNRRVLEVSLSASCAGALAAAITARETPYAALVPITLAAAYAALCHRPSVPKLFLDSYLRHAAERTRSRRKFLFGLRGPEGEQDLLAQVERLEAKARRLRERVAMPDVEEEEGVEEDDGMWVGESAAPSSGSIPDEAELDIASDMEGGDVDESIADDFGDPEMEEEQEEDGDIDDEIGDAVMSEAVDEDDIDDEIDDLAPDISDAFESRTPSDADIEDLVASFAGSIADVLWDRVESVASDLPFDSSSGGGVGSAGSDITEHIAGSPDRLLGLLRDTLVSEVSDDFEDTGTPLIKRSLRQSQNSGRTPERLLSRLRESIATEVSGAMTPGLRRSVGELLRESVVSEIPERASTDSDPYRTPTRKRPKALNPEQLLSDLLRESVASEVSEGSGLANSRILGMLSSSPAVRRSFKQLVDSQVSPETGTPLVRRSLRPPVLNSASSETIGVAIVPSTPDFSVGRETGVEEDVAVLVEEVDEDIAEELPDTAPIIITPARRGAGSDSAWRDASVTSSARRSLISKMRVAEERRRRGEADEVATRLLSPMQRDFGSASGSADPVDYDIPEEVYEAREGVLSPPLPPQTVGGAQGITATPGFPGVPDSSESEEILEDPSLASLSSREARRRQSVRGRKGMDLDEAPVEAPPELPFEFDFRSVEEEPGQYVVSPPVSPGALAAGAAGLPLPSALQPKVHDELPSALKPKVPGALEKKARPLGFGFLATPPPSPSALPPYRGDTVRSLTYCSTRSNDPPSSRSTPPTSSWSSSSISTSTVTRVNPITGTRWDPDSSYTTTPSSRTD
eukprot:Hpha_TRINITY_DN25879_c0_g1::TRINITY_DN25879_c0_g1_i1::g.19846::m.19846